MCLQLYFEPFQGSSTDDTGVNGIEVMCRGPGMDGTTTTNIEQYSSWSDSRWGIWSSTCPSGKAVCALKTRVEPYQGTGSWGSDIDDGALTDARLQCCDF